MTWSRPRTETRRTIEFHPQGNISALELAHCLLVLLPGTLQYEFRASAKEVWASIPSNIQRHFQVWETEWRVGWSGRRTFQARRQCWQVVDREGDYETTFWMMHGPHIRPGGPL